MARTGTYRTRIRYGGTCFVCGADVPKGVDGWYDSERRKVACGPHDLEDTQPPAAVAATTAPAQARGPANDGLPKLIKATRESTCTACGAIVAKGEDLFWVPGTKVAVCPSCTAAEVAAGLTSGTAGGAATRIADGATRKHAERLLSAYPMLGQHLVENAQPSGAMHAWMRGADGERIVGRKLDVLAEEGRIVVLHDRRHPSGGNIDHLVIGPKRISVIDAKHYRNARVTKDRDTLMVGGKPAEHLIDGVRHQKAAVEDALKATPRIADNVNAILAFVGGKLGFIGSITHRGVWCADLKESVAYAAWRGPVIGRTRMTLNAEERQQVAETLARAFPPA
jgi:hypothetical protein